MNQMFRPLVGTILHHILAQMHSKYDIILKRNIGLNVGCSPCDPRVGTSQIKGICTSYCNEWYNACRDDYFHYNKRGLLAACHETDIVCTKLSSIIANGTQLCELSGYDVSHISISCYNGKKAKFKKPPTANEWQGPIDKILKMLKSSRMNKYLRAMTDVFQLMATWQQRLFFDK